MNMFEFVTVKDNILLYLYTHQKEIIDPEIIKNDLKFTFLPNGVVQACIEEMVADHSITIRRIGSGFSLVPAESGKRLLADGGYVKKLTEETTIRTIEGITSYKLHKSKRQFISGKQITVLANTASVLSVLSAALFKR